MTVFPILTSVIESERDVVLARRRAWQLAEPLGFDSQERTRIATAVSEIARNAFKYAGGGRVEFSVESDIDAVLVVVVSDTGAGIANLDEILGGRYVSETGMGLGLVGARRLMDDVTIDTGRSGTSVRMVKKIPPRAGTLTMKRVGAIASELARNTVLDPNEEVSRQNRELMSMLQEVQRRQDELEQLNLELEDTNRGVVALYAELDERADKLRQADQIKSRFLSHMSHEFRTPLSSILALARLLLDRTDGDLSSEQEKQVTYIKRSAQELSELVNDLLDLAKVEAGKVTLTVERFALDQLFASLRGVMRPLVTGNAVTLTFKVVGEPITMISDEAKLGQILRNLISNALKFTERGEVAIVAKRRDENDTVECTIRDTGIGIDPADAELIFDEFGQVHNRVQRRVKGTGLGLPLSRRLAELLGGTLTVESEIGSGSTFTLILPREMGVATDTPSTSLAPRDAQHRVLVVDDEPSPRYLLRKLLEAQGCEVIEATCGSEGLSMAALHAPDLILLDFMMPDLTGLQVAQQLRDKPESSAIPVYMVTSKVLTSEEWSALDGQAISVIPKETVSRDIVQQILRTHGIGTTRSTSIQI